MNKRSIYSLLEKVFGRKILWRVGRWLYLGARREMQNDPRSNGEYNLLRWYAEQAIMADKSVYLFDVGAMHGNWSFQALEEIQKHGLGVKICIFEASPSQARRVRERIKRENTTNMELKELAVSDKEGKGYFKVTGDNTGSSAIVEDDLVTGASTIKVEMTTIDKQMQSLGWPYIDVVKVDTEGHDFKVIKGAIESLREEKIGILQFEYNWRWLESKNSVRDVFSLIEALSYKFGRLSENEIEVYEYWHTELDRFIETNFLLVRMDLMASLPMRIYDFGDNNTACAIVN